MIHWIISVVEKIKKPEKIILKNDTNGNQIPVTINSNHYKSKV